MLRLLLIVIFFFSFGGLTTAQDSCAAQVNITFSRAAGVCREIGRNQACYGSGLINATFQSPAIDPFSQDGDLLALEDLHTISLDSQAGNAWATMFFRMQANLSTNSQRNVLGILFGTVTLTNLSDSVPTINVNPRGTVNIRTSPYSGADIIARVAVNGMITANGRLSDNTWLRVRVPNQDELGWVRTDTITPEQDFNLLEVATVTDSVKQPLEQLNLITSADRVCEDAPESALILQSPSLEEATYIIINNVQIEFAGTVLIQAATNQDLSIQVLEGNSKIEWLTSSAYLTAGAQASLPEIDTMLLEIEPYNMASLQMMPILYLDRRIILPAPLSAAEITNLQLPVSLNPEPQQIEDEPTCQYSVIVNHNIRNGPGEAFSITGEAEAGTAIFPRGKYTNDNGGQWLQVGTYAWINARAVQPGNTCDPLPEISGDFISSVATNKVNLETCRPTTGPIQVGQRITLEFVPHAWDTYAAAREATRYTYGRILVDESILYPRVSEPIKISDDEYIRRFSAEWIAQTGTFPSVPEWVKQLRSASLV